MFDPLFDLIAALLAWFYSVWPSYGAAISMLTLSAMVVATPLTLKGIRSMLQMSEYSADIKRIQNEHRGDRQAINEATMALYREHRINPLGGCLPMFFQAPVFLVLYQVVRGLTRRTTEIGTQIGYTSLQYSDNAGQELSAYVQTSIARSRLTFDPDFLSKDTELYERLSSNNEMVSWGVDLSRTTSAAMSDGVVEAFPYLIMLLLVLVTGLYQYHQLQRRQKNAPVNKQTQLIMRLFPYFLPVISYNIPAAVVVYFIISALYRIAQQAYITKSYYSGEDSLGARAARQRAAAMAEDGRKSSQPKVISAKSKSLKATTEGKGTATPRRSTTQSRSRVPVRKQDSNRDSASGKGSGAAGAGRTGKAPSRGRSGSSRVRSDSGRTTPPGSRPNRSTQNRSKSKKKRR